MKINIRILSFVFCLQILLFVCGGGLFCAPLLPLRSLPVPIVTQATDYSCGAASLLAVLYYWNVSEDFEMDLHESLNTTPEAGTHPASIARIAKEYGLEAEVKEGLTIKDLKQALKKGITVIIDYQAWPDERRIKTPWEELWEDGHYSVLVGIDIKYIYLMDPSVVAGYSYIPIKEFLTRWHDYEVKPDGSIWENYNLGILIKGKVPIKKFPNILVKTN